MIAGLTLWSLLKLWGILLVLFYFFKYVLKPYILVSMYKAQGGVGFYSFGLNFFLKFLNDAREKGDFYFWFKDQLKKNPAIKFFTFNWGSRPILYLVDPTVMKPFFQNIDNYEKHESTVGLFHEWLVGSFIFLEGKKWKRSRKVFSTAFHHEFLRNTVPMMVSIAQEKFGHLVKENHLKNVELVEVSAMIAGEITGRFFFGKRFSEVIFEGKPMTSAALKLANQIMEANFSPVFLLLGKGFYNLGIIPSHRKLTKCISAFRKECEKMIDEERNNPKKEENILKALLAKEHEEGEAAFTNQEIVGEFGGIFAAGTDTTSHLVAISTYYLWKYPKILQRVKEEVDREFADPSKVDLDSLNRMEYLTAFIKESLRTIGPLGNLFNRIAIRDHKLGDIRVRKGTLLTVPATCVHARSNQFTNPEEFIPERFLPSEDPFPNDNWKKEPFSFVPFSAGTRNCIGQHMAMMAAKVMVSMFVKTFKPEYPPDYELKMTVRLTYDTVDPLRVNLIPL